MRLLLFLLLIISHVDTYGNFYDDKARGWFWYEERSKDIPQEGLNHNHSSISASEELKNFQQKLEKSKAAMIMRPSVQNTRRYIEYQNEAFLRADQVAKYWKMAMLSDPALNIVKDIPISDAGARLTQVNTEKSEAKLLQQVAKKFQLLFFYRKSCNYCIYFADVLEAFSRKYGYKVASVTLDGGVIEKFPASFNQGLVTKLNVTYSPSLFIYSQELGVATPVSYGYLSIDLLEKNMIFVVSQLRGKL